MHHGTLRLVGRGKEPVRLAKKNKMARKNPLHVKLSRNVPEMLLPAELFDGLCTQVPFTREIRNAIAARDLAVNRVAMKNRQTSAL